MLSLRRSTTTSGMRKVVFTLLLITLGLFTILDALVFRQFVPHIPVMVSRTLQYSQNSFPYSDNEDIFNEMSNFASDNSIFDYRNKAEVLPHILQNGSDLISFKKSENNFDEKSNIVSDDSISDSRKQAEVLPNMQQNGSNLTPFKESENDFNEMSNLVSSNSISEYRNQAEVLPGMQKNGSDLTPFKKSTNDFNEMSSLVFNNSIPESRNQAEVLPGMPQNGSDLMQFKESENELSEVSNLVSDNSKSDSRKQEEVIPSMPQNGSDLTSSKDRTLITEDLRQKLKKLGYEPAEDHEFKSPYIITPKIYPQVFASSTRKSKVLSCFNCPSWFVSNNLEPHKKFFEKCPYSECVYDASGQYKETADFLIFFFGIQGGNITTMPERPPGQIWIKAYWEPPTRYEYPENYEPWKSAFNWTFHYRTDSDIFAPVDQFAWRDRDELLSDNEYLEIAKKKTKTAAWWVSHCQTWGEREIYVKKMQKYIDVDIYGKCGTLSCEKDRFDECEEMLTTTYKFYLSFENSLCKDYVTEKFFRNFRTSYRSHVIPVGRGGFDYDKYIPNGTFVNAAHFKKAKDLALYLKRLGNDLPTYAKMLKEKDKLVALDRKFDWCDICEKLHTDTKTKIIPDIRAWSHDGICYPADDIV